MLSQVELGRPRGEVFLGYREAALPSSHQEGGGLGRPGPGLAAPGARGGWEPRLAVSALVWSSEAAFLIPCVAPVCGAGVWTVQERGPRTLREAQGVE